MADELQLEVAPDTVAVSAVLDRVAAAAKKFTLEAHRVVVGTDMVLIATGVVVKESIKMEANQCLKTFLFCDLLFVSQIAAFKFRILKNRYFNNSISKNTEIQT